MKPAPPVVAAVAPARFARLFLEALAAGEESPAVSTDTPARLVRGPHERALFALRARIDDDALYHAVSRRFLALLRLLENSDSAPLAQSAPGAGTTLLHPALLDTAARMPLTRNGSFPPKRFRDAAETCARRNYASLAWPPAQVQETTT